MKPAEIAKVERQIWLLRNVNWWYTGPVLVGSCIFAYGLLASFGLPGDLFAALMCVFVAGFLIIGWRVHRANQRAIGNELEPMRRELEGVCDALNEINPPADSSER